MKISIQSRLLSDFVGRLGVLQKSNSALDEGSYILLYVQDGKLTGMVNRQDLLAEVVLDSQLVADTDIFQVEGKGAFAVNGDLLIKLAKSSNIDGLIDIVFEDCNDGFSKKDGEDYDGLLKAVGALKLSFPSLGKKKEQCWLQCVEQQKPILCQSDPQNHASLDASVLLDMINKVGVAAGKNSASLNYSQIMVRTIKNSPELEIATHDGHEIGWAKFNVQKSGAVFGVVPYDILGSICRIVDPKCQLTVSVTKTGPKGLTIEQEYRYADAVVGGTKYCILSVSDKFVEFEKVLKNLSFRYKCKADKHNVSHVANRLDPIDMQWCTAKFSSEDKTLSFSKVSSMVRGEDIVLPLKEAEGESLELKISSKMLKKAVAQCDFEEMDIRFSGKKSLGVITLSSSCKLFFAPFSEPQ